VRGGPLPYDAGRPSSIFGAALFSRSQLLRRVPSLYCGRPGGVGLQGLYTFSLANGHRVVGRKGLLTLIELAGGYRYRHHRHFSSLTSAAVKKFLRALLRMSFAVGTI